MKIRDGLTLFLVIGILALPAQAQNNTVVDPYANRSSPNAPVSQPTPMLPETRSVPSLPTSRPELSPVMPESPPKSMAELAAEAETQSAEVVRLCRSGRTALTAMQASATDLARRSGALEKRLATWQTQTSAVIPAAPTVVEARGRLALAQQRLRDAVTLAEGGAGGACGALDAAKKDLRSAAQRQFLTDAREGSRQAQAAVSNRDSAVQQCQSAAQELRAATANIPAGLAAQKSLSGEVLAIRNALQDSTIKRKSVLEAVSALLKARDNLVKIQKAAEELRVVSVAPGEAAAYSRLTKAVTSAPDCVADLQSADNENVGVRAEAIARRAEEIAASSEGRALEVTLSAREMAGTAAAACRSESVKISAAAPRAASCLSSLESLSGPAVARQAADLEAARRRCPPGSRPQWNDTQDAAECACPTAEGMMWNADQSACNSRASFDQWAAERCRAELQGSVVASGDPVTGQYSCRCPSGRVRANDGRACLDAADLRAHCNRILWGSEPIEAYSDGRVQCGCPRGTDSYRGECVRADLFDTPYRRSYPFGGGGLFDRDRFDRDRCYRDRFNGRIYCDRL